MHLHNLKKTLILHLTWHKTYMILNGVLYLLTYLLSGHVTGSD